MQESLNQFIQAEIKSQERKIVKIKNENLIEIDFGLKPVDSIGDNF